MTWPRSRFAAFAFIAIWTVGFGWPLLRLEGFDDAFFSEAAHLWTQGRPPYLAVFDVKPPGYFALLALAQALFGPSIETLHGLSLACNVVTACSLYAIGRRLDAEAAGFAAALTFAVLAAFLLANDAYPPLVALTTLAFLAALSPGGAAWSGLACGAAMMVKQTAVMEAAALLFIFARGSWRAAFVFGVTAATIPLGFVGYFAAQGGLAPFWRDVVTDALERPDGVERVSLAADSARLLTRLALLGPVPLLAALGAIRARALAPRADLLALWAGAALLGLAIQHARGLAYLGPLMPPALLLAFLFAGRGLPGGGATLKIAATASLAVVAAFPLRAEAVRRPADFAATREAAALIAAAHPAPGDKLLAVDFGGWLNIATDLAPPTAYIHRMHLLCRFPDAGPARLEQAFAASPRFVVIGLYRGQPTACDEGSSARPLADAALARDYREIGHVAGRSDDLTLFERRP
jgi:hypothetical protein